MMSYAVHPSRSCLPTPARRGSILIIAMVIVFALASLVLSLGRWARAESLVSVNEVASLQAIATERGAEQFVVALLTSERENLYTMKETDFQAVAVGAGYFWIIRPNFGDHSLPTYGLLDESAKIDINSASLTTLTLLSGMTQQLAGSIIDWRDSNDVPTSGGAESSDYMSGTDPYSAKNAPFESVEELLLVKGFTPAMLYGSATDLVFSSDLPAGYGLFDRFTLWNTRPNTAADGSTRSQLNGQQNRAGLRTMLGEKFGQSRGDQIVRAIGPGNVRDLFDFAQRTNLTPDELAKIEDYVTTANDVTQPLRNRINIFQAPREVIQAIAPQLSSDDIEKILSNREAEQRKSTTSVAWVYNLLRDKAIGMGNSIAGQGRQFSADIVAASANGRAFKRVRIVVDTSDTTPRIVYRRDLSERGWPLDASILQSLRQGNGPGGVAGATSFTQGTRQ